MKRNAKLRIGQIPYANCTPLFTVLRAEWDGERYRFVTGDPTRLNRLLVQGRIDVCPASSIAYARHADALRILPDLSISAVGTVESILLLSRVPLGDLDRRSIACTAASASSVVLLKILLSRFHRIRARLVTARRAGTGSLKRHAAVLLIGDDALRAAQREAHLYRYDLGRMWHDYTGLPFVFALWLARRELLDRIPEDLHRLASDLRQAKAKAYRSLGSMARTAPEAQWLGTKALLRYWRTISYDFTHQHEKGLRRFYREAKAVGAIARVPPLRFL